MTQSPNTTADQPFRRALRWIPAILWMTLIFLMSHQKGEGSGALSRLILETMADFGLDLRVLFGDYAFVFIRKAAHFMEYFILYHFLYFALGKAVAWSRRGWIALFLTFLYASSDEFHQTFIPKRTGLFSDVLVDTAGGAFAFLLQGLLRRWRAWRKGK